MVAGRTVTVGRPNFGHLERVELFVSGYDVTYPSCNLAYRRDLFLRLGGFDPRFVTAEDIDLNLRAVEAGVDIRYEPNAVVYHHIRTTFYPVPLPGVLERLRTQAAHREAGRAVGTVPIRRLLSGQRSPIAWARLTAAILGYLFRVCTGW